MSKFPTELDTDVELPRVDDNITEIGAEAINALRDAMFNVQSEVGVGGSGTVGSIAGRIDVSIAADGTIRPSALTSLGLVTLPIRNLQVASDAAIDESKLNLNFTTSYLNDQIAIVKDKQKTVDEFLSVTGIKVEPHVSGLGYRHKLSHIDVDSPSTTPNLSTHLLNKKNVSRDITDSFELLKDLNTDYVLHQKSNGLPQDATVAGTGTLPPDNFAHVSAGIYLDTSSFTSVDKTNNSVQLFAEAIDKNSLLLIGSRVQNLYSNGISRTSRSSVLDLDGYGQNVIPPTLVTTYLLDGGSSTPVDDITTGDDIIQFKPTLSDNSFDAKFASIKPGDVVRIDYGTIVVSHIVESKKYTVSKDGGGAVIGKSFFVRINGKNLLATTSGLARIDKPLANDNKYGVLALAAANNSNISPTQPDYPSLIVGNPRSAKSLGLGFDPSKLDGYHYNLYLQLYPHGDLTKATVMPAIDVTGNQGATPGRYTLDSVIDAFNSAVRKNGYNFRFMAYSYAGDFGIMLSDPYNNTSFSIISGSINTTNGLYDKTTSELGYPNNVIGINSSGEIDVDPLGFGPNGSGIASPPYTPVYTTPESAVPTKVFVPLQRNFYYVNGVETENIKKEVFTSRDTFGDGYWPASVVSKNILGDRIEVTYQIDLDLSTSGLKTGKTLVVQPKSSTSSVIDYGRFIINSVSFYICDGYAPYTTIKVYDGVHATGISPYATGSVSEVNIYFSDDSVSFNTENVSDSSATLPYRRHFEVLVDQDAHIFTHERARISISDTTDIGKVNIINVSPKLRGYKLSAGWRNISLGILTFDSAGNYVARLAKDNTLLTNLGPLAFGKKGSVTRVYDETNVDYIEILFDINESIPTFSSKAISIDLFPTLTLDDEVMLIGTCQIDDITKKVKYLRDARQFGNVSEKILSTSALDFIAAGEKYLHDNGVVRGFDLTMSGNTASLTGGIALVNGKLISKDNGYVTIPYVQEVYSAAYYTNIQWAICINDKSEYQLVPLLDYDSSLSVPNNTTRLFQAYNPSNSLAYYLEAMTFAELVDKRKDLTVLHVVVTSVT